MTKTLTPLEALDVLHTFALRPAGERSKFHNLEMDAHMRRISDALSAEPVAWMHTLYYTEEGNPPFSRYSASPENPFGHPGKDYSEEYTVVTQPLFTSPPDQSARIEEPLTLDEIEAIVREHFYAAPMGGATKRLCAALDDAFVPKDQSARITEQDAEIADLRARLAKYEAGQ